MSQVLVFENFEFFYIPITLTRTSGWKINECLFLKLLFKYNFWQTLILAVIHIVLLLSHIVSLIVVNYGYYNSYNVIATVYSIIHEK